MTRTRIEKTAGDRLFGGTSGTWGNSESYREARLAGESYECLEPFITRGALLQMSGLPEGETFTVQYEIQASPGRQVFIEPDRYSFFHRVSFHACSLCVGILVSPDRFHGSAVPL